MRRQARARPTRSRWRLSGKSCDAGRYGGRFRMALKSTICKAELSVADVDRGITETTC